MEVKSFDFREGKKWWKMYRKDLACWKKNCMGYLLSLGDLNNSNNSWMQINILKTFNLDKLEKKK